METQKQLQEAFESGDEEVKLNEHGEYLRLPLLAWELLTAMLEQEQKTGEVCRIREEDIKLTPEGKLYLDNLNK